MPDMRDSSTAQISAADAATDKEERPHLSRIKVSLGNGDPIMTVRATHKSCPDRLKISYTNVEEIDSGAFGRVFKAVMQNSEETVAMKVIKANSASSRELKMMRLADHWNIVDLKYFFYFRSPTGQVYLNMVMEFIPCTLWDIMNKRLWIFPPAVIEVYMYQLCRALAYLHGLGICHRDVKPTNILVDHRTKVLKLADLGSAKVLDKSNTSHPGTRMYRAPELLFGATQYTCKVDVWSAGCVLAELLPGRPLFNWPSSEEQLQGIYQVLGTPTSEDHEDIGVLPPLHSALPKVKPQTWRKVLGARSHPEAIDLVSKLLTYKPSTRLDMLVACAHPFFDGLRLPGAKLPDGRDLPPLFNFTEQELKSNPHLASTLMPKV